MYASCRKNYGFRSRKYFGNSPFKGSRRWLSLCILPPKVSRAESSDQLPHMCTEDRSAAATARGKGRIPRSSVDSESFNLSRNDSLWYGNFGSVTGGQASPRCENAVPVKTTPNCLSHREKRGSFGQIQDPFGTSERLETSVLTEYTHEVESLSEQLASERSKTESPDKCILSRYYEKEELNDGIQIDSWFGFDVPSESDDWEELETDRSILKSLKSPPLHDELSSCTNKNIKSRGINPSRLRCKVRSLSSLNTHSIKRSSTESSHVHTRASSFQFRMMNGLSNFARSISTLSSKE
jgi:hypothetical protein